MYMHKERKKRGDKKRVKDIKRVKKE